MTPPLAVALTLFLVCLVLFGLAAWAGLRNEYFGLAWGLLGVGVLCNVVGWSFFAGAVA